LSFTYHDQGKETEKKKHASPKDVRWEQSMRQRRKLKNDCRGTSQRGGTEF
jgi:hypothetical protein